MPKYPLGMYWLLFVGAWLCGMLFTMGEKNFKTKKYNLPKIIQHILFIFAFNNYTLHGIIYQVIIYLAIIFIQICSCFSFLVYEYAFYRIYTYSTVAMLFINAACYRYLNYKHK